MKELQSLDAQFERQSIAGQAIYQSAQYHLPDSRGHFGQFGGTFVSETLTHALTELKEAYAKFQHDAEFLEEFRNELKYFVGRPSPVYHAKRWSDLMGGGANLFQA